MAYQYYNLTNLTGAGNDSTILTFAQGINTQMNAAPTLLILAAIYIILMMALIGKGANPFKAFTAVSFAVMILAIIVYPMGLIGGKHLVLFCIMSPLSLFILFVFGGETV